MRTFPFVQNMAVADRFKLIHRFHIALIAYGVELIKGKRWLEIEYFKVLGIRRVHLLLQR